MNKIISKNIASKKIGHTLYNTVQMNKNKGERITVDDVKKIAERLEKEKEKSGNKFEFIIRGVNGDRYKTFKAYNEEDLNFKEMEDYYDGLDEENSNFMNFYQIQVSIKKYV
jgi:hypothetical protein